MSTRCFFFGCWNVAGHYLFAPGGQSASRLDRQVAYYSGGIHIDGTLAPRRMAGSYGPVKQGELCWAGMSTVQKERDYINYNSGEYPQGQFLRHELDNGFTALQWWDRCQGDTRGACNSTILLEGKHTSEELLEALRKNFPHVLENLERGGPDIEKLRRRYSNTWRPPNNQGRVELVEVKR